MRLIDVMQQAQLVTDPVAAMLDIVRGAVRMNGATMRDPDAEVTLKAGDHLEIDRERWTEIGPKGEGCLFFLTSWTESCFVAYRNPALATSSLNDPPHPERPRA